MKNIAMINVPAEWNLKSGAKITFNAHHAVVLNVINGTTIVIEILGPL